MTDMTKGFGDGRFSSLAGRDGKDILELMARVAEQAYRRGVQQGAGRSDRPGFRADLGAWRYEPSLDLAPWVDRPRMTTSLERLVGECGDGLRRLGLPMRIPAAAGRWLITSKRSVWIGYSPEQRARLAAAREKPWSK